MVLELRSISKFWEAPEPCEIMWNILYMYGLFFVPLSKIHSSCEFLVMVA